MTQSSPFGGPSTPVKESTPFGAQQDTVEKIGKPDASDQ
jgi:hypothetical protein